MYMCDRAEKLAKQMSEGSHKHGRNALVNLRFAIEAYIRPFVVARYEGTKELRLSKCGKLGLYC